MPRYLFKCPKCDATTEKQQSFDDPPPTCAECDRLMVKQVARSSFALKGRWFKQGY